MKRPDEVSYSDLVELVTLLQVELFRERDKQSKMRWNYSKVHDLQDLLQHLANLMDRYQLAPDQVGVKCSSLHADEV